jgi:rsbT co-antagonist protein RsbR
LEDGKFIFSMTIFFELIILGVKMDKFNATNFISFLDKSQDEIINNWVKEQTGAKDFRSDLIKETELRQQSIDFFHAFKDALAFSGSADPSSDEWSNVRSYIESFSRSKAIQGFSPSETALFIFSLKNSLLNLLRSSKEDLNQILNSVNYFSVLLDKLGLLAVDIYLKSKEEIITRQQMEMIELSTPVVQLWQGILALPLIGTLDSARTQVVMENLLTKIVETGSSIAIVDITGVPTVDTLVAQHLLKTVAAARLMGADCIISGIRPQIAQTIVHLGVNLEDVITKATMADAFKMAMKHLNDKSFKLLETKHQAK